VIFAFVVIAFGKLSEGDFYSIYLYYITDNVLKQSIVVNRKSQTPTVLPSAVMGDSWKGMKLK